jgi:hypothetical protein
MKYLLIALTIGLLVAHQDYWNWDNGTLVGGCLPMGLVYHLGISLAAGAVWFLAVTLAWPKSFSDLDADISRQSQLDREVAP